MNYTWTISAVDCKVKEDSLENIIQTVHWRLRGENEEGISAEVYGAEPLPDPNPDNFKIFSEIKKEDIVGWLESIFSEVKQDEEGVDLPTKIEALKSSIVQQIEDKVNPKTVTLTIE